VNQALQAAVHQQHAAPVEMVHHKDAPRPGRRRPRGFLLQGLERLRRCAGHPGEQAPHRGLARLVPDQARHDAVLHDTGHALNGEGFARVDHVAHTRAQHHGHRPVGGHARARHPSVRVDAGR